MKKKPDFDKYLFANVFGEVRECETLEEHRCGTLNGVSFALGYLDVNLPWPPHLLRKEIEKAKLQSTDPMERRDLAMATFELCNVENFIAEGNADQAALFAMAAQRYLAQYEARARRRHSAAGGRATKRLTAEQEKLALSIIEQKKKGLGKRWKTAACLRAAEDMRAIHDIPGASKDILLRLLRRQD